MQADPQKEWQRLRDLYHEMGEIELEELAADLGSLTETAQQVLRDELKIRGLDKPQRGEQPPKASGLPEVQPWDQSPLGEQDDARATGLGPLMGGHWQQESPRPEGNEAEESGDQPFEYSWKTELCECDAREEAWQVHEVLRRAGVESWIESPRSYMDAGGFRVLVAADQLDHAQAIAERPIPQEIVELSHMEAPEYQPPVCPRCGAADPVLEAVEPCNAWKCEACGNEWTEAADSTGSEADESG